MWWQDHLYVWQHLILTRDILLLALLVVIDAITGLSRYLAMALGMKNRRDQLLLAILIVCSIWVYYRTDFFPYQNSGDMFFADDAFRATAERRRKLLVFYYWFLPELEVVSAAICAMLARSQGRSFFLWMPLGYLGNVGAIVWLVLNRKKDKARQAGIAEQPA